MAAPPEDAAPRYPRRTPTAACRLVRYLEAGAPVVQQWSICFGQSVPDRAQSYRDQLSVSEKTVLDAYLKELARVPADSAVAPAGATVTAASPAPGKPGTAPATPAAAAPAAGANASNSKQAAEWKLKSAREQIRQGDYDAATRLVGEVQAMNVRLEPVRRHPGQGGGRHR